MTTATVRPRCLRSVIAISMALGVPAYSARAAESSATNFPSGVNTALTALYPPSGATEFYNFNLFYNVSKYASTANNPIIPSLHTNIFAEALRVNHTWLDLTPSITFGSGFALNAVYQDLNVGGQRFRSGIQLSDPAIIPYNFGFHVLPDLWVAHIFNIFPGIGQYSRNDALNQGVGYSTFAPEVALTYLPGKVEIGFDAHYDFNTKNTHTNYQSGNFLNVDYNIGYRPIDSLPGLQVGVSGFFLKQLQDDTLNGTRVGDGNRAQAFAYGPLIRYDIGHGGLLLKWQHETDVQNRTKGERIWFQFAIPLPL